MSKSAIYADETQVDFLLRKLRRTMVARLRKKQCTERKTDLTAWGHRFCPHYFTKPPSEFHNNLGIRLARAAKKREVREVFIGPRGNAKSTYITFVYPLAAVCEEWEKYIILVADTAAQAEKYLSDIKDELEGNEQLEQRYSDATGQGPVWNVGRVITKNGICIEALGIASKIRGRRFREHRPSCIIIDDPEGNEASYSSIKRDRVWSRIVRDIFKAGAPKTNIMASGTKVHRECAVARLAEMPGWESSQFKSIVRWPERMDLWEEFENILANISDVDRDEHAREYYEQNRSIMNKGAKVLWPEHEPLLDLMYQRAAEGHSAFEAEKQNNPVDPATCEWLPEHFPETPDSDKWFDDWPQHPECKIIAVDPSKGRQDKPGDYQAIIELAVFEGILYWDADIARRQLPQFVEAIFNHIDVFKPDVAVCESNQFQELIIHEVEHYAKTQGLLAPVEEMENYAIAKHVRIRRLSPYISRARCRFKRRSKGIRMLIDQLLDFPNGSHDDGPDAAEMAVRRASMLLASKKRRPVKNPR